MLVTFCIAAIGKMNVPTNKVHFYVTCEVNHHRGKIIHTLWLGKPIYTEDKRFVPDKQSHILDFGLFVSYKLHYSDFEDMKEGEIREVFINMED